MDKTDRLSDWEETEKRDRDGNGIDDEIQPPTVDIEAGSAELAERLREHHSTDPSLSAGDIDARWEDAEGSGEETVAGSAPTPGQDDTRQVASAMGIEYADDEPLKVGEKERNRDKNRFELDPASSEDWQERARRKN